MDIRNNHRYTFRMQRNTAAEQLFDAKIPMLAAKGRFLLYRMETRMAEAAAVSDFNQLCDYVGGSLFLDLYD